MSGDGGARILVVDDVPENVRLLEAVLAPRGYDVISAGDVFVTTSYPFIDIASGGGGPLLSILTELPGVDVVLTDLYPNVDAFARAEARLRKKVGLREGLIERAR